MNLLEWFFDAKRLWSAVAAATAFRPATQSGSMAAALQSFAGLASSSDLCVPNVVSCSFEEIRLMVSCEPGGFNHQHV